VRPKFIPDDSFFGFQKPAAEYIEIRKEGRGAGFFKTIIRNNHCYKLHRNILNKPVTIIIALLLCVAFPVHQSENLVLHSV